MLAPVHVAAYDANAARPDASVARFTLPDLEMDGVMDPFGDNLMPRRAMEHGAYAWGAARVVISWLPEPPGDCEFRDANGDVKHSCHLCAAGCSF